MKELGNKKSKLLSFLGSKNAFTLIEILATIVIVGIITIVFSSSFINNIKLINVSGNKIKKINEVRTKINESIASSTTTSSDSITIIFNEGEEDEKTLSINGSEITQSVNYETLNGNNSVSISYFKAVISE